MMMPDLLVSLILATLVYAALVSALFAAVLPAHAPAFRWSVVAVVVVTMTALVLWSGQVARAPQETAGGSWTGWWTGWWAGSWAGWAGWGRFSITSGLLALLYLLHPVCMTRPGWQPLALPDGQRRMLIVGVVVAGLLVYPAALGVALPGTATLDIWGSGYGDFRLATALLCLGLALWVLRAYHLCLLLVAAQCAFALQLLPSGNLWDYLIDPWLWVGSMVAAVSLRRRHPGPARPDLSREPRS